MNGEERFREGKEGKGRALEGKGRDGKGREGKDFTYSIMEDFLFLKL